MSAGKHTFVLNQGSTFDVRLDKQATE